MLLISPVVMWRSLHFALLVVIVRRQKGSCNVCSRVQSNILFWGTSKAFSKLWSSRLETWAYISQNGRFLIPGKNMMLCGRLWPNTICATLMINEKIWNVNILHVKLNFFPLSLVLHFCSTRNTAKRQGIVPIYVVSFHFIRKMTSLYMTMAKVSGKCVYWCVASLSLFIIYILLSQSHIDVFTDRQNKYNSSKISK